MAGEKKKQGKRGKRERPQHYIKNWSAVAANKRSRVARCWRGNPKALERALSLLRIRRGEADGAKAGKNRSSRKGKVA